MRNIKEESQIAGANAIIAGFMKELATLPADTKELYDKVQEIYKKHRKKWDAMILVSRYINPKIFDKFRYTKIPKPTDEEVRTDIVNMLRVFVASIPPEFRQPLDNNKKIVQ